MVKKNKMKMTIVKPMMILPPRKDLCQECAIAHKPEDPHNATSLFYLTKFKMQNNREATWADAMSHCSKKIKDHWTKELKKQFNIDIHSYKIFGG